jgi:putative hydrolase of the HAD superfamily
MTVSLVLVDFDDTLVVTEPRFSNARRDLFARLAEVGFPEADARHLHETEVDLEMLGTFGLGPHRLEHSFRETYARLCTRAGVPVNDAVAEECAAFGRSVAGTPEAIDGALEALRILADAYPTVIYTQSGDPEYQIQCVRESGVIGVVAQERVRVCARKTVAEHRLTLEHYGVSDPRTAWMVGNSVRSDINPALAAGSNAILVETGTTWVHEHAEPITDDFVRVNSFSHAVDYLLALPERGDKPCK